VKEGQALEGIPGLMTLRDGRCVYNPRPRIADMDTIPFPTYEEFDRTHYLGDALILEWSRGCIGSCTYCKGKEIAGDYRTRSARHIFDELKYHVEVNGYRNFTVCDPLINGAPEVLEELCDKIIASGYSIRFNGEGIPMPTMTSGLLQKMKAAGCWNCSGAWSVGRTWCSRK